jgi:hypothetical protein
MKMFFSALLPLLSLLPSYAQAGWDPILVCENYRMVVDRSSDGYGYQLVIRNHQDTLSYFASKASIGATLNEKGEMIVSLSPGGPGIDGPSSLYVGYIGGSTNVVVSRVAGDVIRVGLWEVGYRGTHAEEVANWDFRGCFAR